MLPLSATTLIGTSLATAFQSAAFTPPVAISIWPCASGAIIAGVLAMVTKSTSIACSSKYPRSMAKRMPASDVAAVRQPMRTVVGAPPASGDGAAAGAEGAGAAAGAALLPAAGAPGAAGAGPLAAGEAAGAAGVAQAARTSASRTIANDVNFRFKARSLLAGPSHQRSGAATAA